MDTKSSTEMQAVYFKNLIAELTKMMCIEREKENPNPRQIKRCELQIELLTLDLEELMGVA